MAILFCQPLPRSTASLVLYDSQTAIWRISVIFPQEKCQDWEAQESWNIFVALGGAEA